MTQEESYAKAMQEVYNIEAKTTAEVLQIKADARFECAKLETDAMIKDSQAEGEHSQNLEPKRKHLQRMQRAQSMSHMVGESKMVISGENGSELLKYFSDLD